MVEAAAEILFWRGPRRIKNDCASSASHEIAKLIGSPPGYLGHRETHPLITKRRWLPNYGRPEAEFLLFDEIEKAKRCALALLLGMLDKAR